MKLFDMYKLLKYEIYYFKILIQLLYWGDEMVVIVVAMVARGRLWRWGGGGKLKMLFFLALIRPSLLLLLSTSMFLFPFYHVAIGKLRSHLWTICAFLALENDHASEWLLLSFDCSTCLYLTCLLHMIMVDWSSSN